MRDRFHARPTAATVFLVLLTALVAACGGSGKSTATNAQADYRTLVGAGSDLLRQGNVGAAEQLFEQAIAKNPNDPVGYYDLGVAYQQEGLARQAVRQYRRALAVNDQYVPALYNEAVIMATRNVPTAIFLYRQIIAIKPDSPTALLNLGLLEARENGLEREAYRDLTRAIRLDPRLRSAVPAMLLAPLSRQAGRRTGLKPSNSHP